MDDWKSDRFGFWDVRMQYLRDVSPISDAIIEACCPLRISYSIMANTDHYLHTHIQARYDWELEEYISNTAWAYPDNVIYDPAQEYSEEKHGELKRRIRENW